LDQYISEIFNRFKDQEFVSDVNNDEVVDAFNSPIAGSSRLQEGNELDNFWLGRNLNDLNNLTFENNFNAIEINENSERRNRLLNELLRSSLENQAENGLENCLSHDSFEDQSNERVQVLFNPKKYDIENIISLDPLVSEVENESIQPEDNSKYDIHDPTINNDANDLESEATVEVRLDDKSFENDIIVIQNESEEIPQDETINDNDQVNFEQRLNNNQRNKKMRFFFDKASFLFIIKLLI
jgi:hypothetical protein